MELKELQLLNIVAYMVVFAPPAKFNAGISVRLLQESKNALYAVADKVPTTGWVTNRGIAVNLEQLVNIPLKEVTFAALNNGTEVRETQLVNIFTNEVAFAVLNNGTEVRA